MSILKEITNSRRKNLPNKKDFINVSVEKNDRDFIKALKSQRNDKKNLIAEVKRKSPSKGEIRPDANIIKVIDWYKPYASAISVLTEPNYFGGSLNDLKQAAQLCSLPLLRKDFLTDPIQVKEARINHANAYLLIVGALTKNQLQELIECGKEWNIPALVEVHNEKELEVALDCDIEILGINNRDLTNLTINLSTTQRLLDLIPQKLKEKFVLISESGIENKKDVLSLPNQIDAILVGTSIMKSQDPIAQLKNLTEI